ncbi:histidinol-phosphate transaminase [Calditrichota bacterium]
MQPPTVPNHISALKPYQPGRSIDEIREQLDLEFIIKLASNENPLGPSPKAIEYIQNALSSLATYPNSGLTLRKQLAVKFQIDVENVVAGAGSESILSAVMRAYLQPGDDILTAEGTFIGFYVLCAAQNLNCRTLPLKNYTFDLSSISEAITNKTRLIYLANPNNPTGTAFTQTEFERFLDDLPEDILLIMDEAYFEFAGEWSDYPDSLNYKHDQVLTLRTFSKAYGLAGVRIGYGIGHPEIITNILKVKLPFEPTSLAQAAGLGALEDDEFLRKALETNRNGRALMVAEFEKYGFSIPRSLANFIFIPMESPENANRFSDDLLKRGIIARPMNAFRLPEGVRISVGKEDEVLYLIKVMNEIFR